MSEENKSVKDAPSASKDVDNWLIEQTAKAAQNLKSRPVERRGPYVLSDDDLNRKFTLG